MLEKIRIEIDNNERGSDRANGLILAAANDARFAEPVFAELPVDVVFSLDLTKTECVEDSIGCQAFPSTTETKRYLVELKEPADYVASALSPTGHLYEQYLAMAEAGQHGMILVLGGDVEVSRAILESLNTRYEGPELIDQAVSYEKRLIHFESSCESLGCPVERWLSMPYTRLLSRVATRLVGKASLMDYRPRPSEEERQVAALTMLLGNGIGPSKAAAILGKFQICLRPTEFAMMMNKPSRWMSLEDCSGIGPKLADRIRKKIEVLE
jgi:hypothetical protein